MAKRYFQHLNPHDAKFQSITTLEMIDDADPSFVLYYFEDGTKCNKEFVGALNEQNVLGNKELVEVSSPANKWIFELKPQKQEQQEKIKTQSGEWVDVPTEDQWFGKSKKSEKDNYIVKAKPRYVEPKAEDDDFNFNDVALQSSNEANDVQQIEEVVDQKQNDDVTLKPNVSEIATQVQSKVDEFRANIKELETLLEKEKNKKISNFDINKFAEDLVFEYNGKSYRMSRDEFFKNATTSMAEKIAKNEEISEHIEIGIDEVQKNLIDNMIDMSQKEQCDIDMSLTLNLPPMSVYKLIKSVYPKGMATGFVNIIADRLKTIQLKKAVAAGLLAYYDEDLDIEVVEKEQDVDSSIVIEDTCTKENDQISFEDIPVVQKKKGGRPKKA